MQILCKGKKEIENIGSSQYSHHRIKALSGTLLIQWLFACSELHIWLLCLSIIYLQSGNFGKLNKPIKFPEILDLAPFIRGTSDKSPVYRLYGVVVHLDVMNSSFSGHYVCYVKNSKNKWFKIDDSTVYASMPFFHSWCCKALSSPLVKKSRLCFLSLSYLNSNHNSSE